MMGEQRIIAALRVSRLVTHAPEQRFFEFERETCRNEQIRADTSAKK